MNTDLMLLTLLYAVALTAFIGAINSRGPARVVLSYFLAILTLCAAVFHTSQFVVSGSLAARSEEAVVLTPPPFPGPAEMVAAPVSPAIDSAALAPSANEVAIGQSRNDLRDILEMGRRISRGLTALNLGSVAEISDEEYENMQNKAVGFLSEARRAKDKLTPLLAGAPNAVKPAGNNLSGGMEALVTAAYNAERFFKSENDTEEKAHLTAFRRGNQAAMALFKRAGSELGADSGQPADAGD